MTKTRKTKNGRKIQTLIQNEGYEISYSRPVQGVKNEITFLNVTAAHPTTGEVSKVRLDGRAVATLRRVLAQA